MRVKKLKVITVLLAGIIVAVVGFLDHYTVKELAYTFLAVVVVFYILASIIQGAINKALTDTDNIADQEKTDENEATQDNIDDNKQAKT